MYDFLLVVQTIIVLMLIGIILIQRSDSDGFGTGGGGGNQFMTGRSSANMLTRTTAILATAFILLSLILAKISSGTTGTSIVDLVEKPAQTSTSAPLVDAQDEPAKPVEPASVPQPE